MSVQRMDFRKSQLQLFWAARLPNAALTTEFCSSHVFGSQPSLGITSVFIYTRRWIERPDADDLLKRTCQNLSRRVLVDVIK